MDNPFEWVQPTTMIPDLLRRAPQARPVLDRYGLHGCGGALGPAESLEFFAHAHDVPLERLMAEVRQALNAPEPAAPAPEPAASPADTIYQPFFKAGIILTLTLGAVWGAVILIGKAMAGTFISPELHQINAHGHAQIFGWVGLFVMGFAYQAFPRFKHTTLAFPRLARATFWWMLAGVILRSVLEPLHGLGLWAQRAAVGGGVLEIAAAVAFAGIILETLRRSGKPLAHYDYYIIAALFFFIVQAVYETLYFAATLRAVTFFQLIPLVGIYQSSLRDLQIHGFAMLMILGVSQRIFHYFYGLPAPSARRSLALLPVIVAAVVGEAAGKILIRRAGPAWEPLWLGSIVTLFVAVLALVWGWGIFARPAESDRSLKFLRVAYLWLFAALAMLAATPFYDRVLVPWFAPLSQSAGMGFSHVWHGATRHAITVGFISLMIVGVASKVVPTLKGVDVRTLSPLWAPFILINLGCAARVTGQVLTDFTPAAYPLAGASGLFEVAGLAIWGAHLLGIMRRREGESEPLREGRIARLTPQTPIQPAHRVAEVLEACPWLLETFVQFGFTPLTSPVLRATMARGVSIQTACRIHSTDLERFLEALNAARVAGRPQHVTA